MNNPRELLVPLRSSLFTCISAVFVLVMASGALHAAVLEEVVVTAQKREQNLQDIGVSVTAFSGAQMRKLGFVESNDLIAQTPGLEVSGYGGGAIASFNVRGVGQNDYTANQEAPVALYIDEAYQSSNVTTRFSMFDVERAEVLRGPQGTLFGRNSTGGLVHYITTKPSQEFGGFVDVTLGEEGRRRVEAAAGGGLTDGVSGRLSMVYNEDDGLLDNDIGTDAQQADDWAVRGQLLIEPSEELSILLKAQYADEDAAPNGWTLNVPSYNATDFFGYVDEIDGNPYTISNDFDFFQKTEVINLYGKINWDLGSFTLTSITDYQDIEHDYAEDSDSTPDSVYHYTQTADIEQISQELRLSWEGERHRSVIGVYYLDIDGDFSTEQSGLFYFGPDIFDEFAVQSTTTYAIFGQTEFDLTGQLTLILGVRYNDDDKDYTLTAPDFGFPTYMGSLNEDDFNAKVQFDYKLNDDWLLYAGWNRGIKSGGFNFPLTPVSGDVLPYSGEVLTSYEAGFKASLSDTTRLNVSAYYYDYDDYQAYNIDPFFNALLFNAEAEFYGGEIELVANPVEGLDILLGASFSDTEITGLPTDFNSLDPVTFAPAQTYPTGKEKAPLAPDVTFNGLVRYSWPAFGGQLALQGDFRWTDDQKFNLSESEIVTESSYGIVNARLDYTSGDEAWSAAIFVNNLTDEEYRTFGVDASLFFGSGEDVFAPKRWVGGSIGYNF